MSIQGRTLLEVEDRASPASATFEVGGALVVAAQANKYSDESVTPFAEASIGREPLMNFMFVPHGRPSGALVVDV